MCHVRGRTRAYLCDFLYDSQYTQLARGVPRGRWRGGGKGGLTFMYVTISVGDGVSMGGGRAAEAALTIVALSLFAQPGEESLAGRGSATGAGQAGGGQGVPLAL